MQVLKILTLFLFTISTYSANGPLGSSVKLYEKVKSSVKDVGNVENKTCSSSVESIDRSIFTPEYENLIDPNENVLKVSGVTMEYLNELFLEISKNKEIPFEYAQRGCEAQAHKVTKLLEEKGIISAKAFIQSPRGKSLLKFKTNSSSKGFVEWEHHVAPVVKVRTGKKKIIEVKTGWFSSKKIEVDEYKNMVIDPTTSNRPIEVSKWKEKFVSSKNLKAVETFYTKRFNFFAADKYANMEEYSDRNEFNMMSGLDIGLTCIDNKKKNITDRRCD
jgi:hypothetical protein